MRLSKVTKDYNVSLQRVVAVLQEHGVAVEPNLNSKIDDKYAELFAEKFGADKARKDQAEKQFQGRRVEKQQALEQALEQGAIRTYALSGQYPQSLNELLEDYHITYDHSPFVVEYMPNGSNLLPSISVIPLSDSFSLRKEAAS